MVTRLATQRSAIAGFVAGPDGTEKACFPSDSTDLEIIDAALCGDAAHKMP
jgi:hypothetical protein